METKMPTILDEIIKHKELEIKERAAKISIDLIENMIVEENTSVRSFYGALKKKIDQNKNAVIAEIKKASPSKGIICENFDPVLIAKSYEENGAACLSVLTDEKFFQGSELYLDEARNSSQLPVLQKDFIISEYQVFESRVMGADCILLIAACLSHEDMLKLTRLAHDLGMDVIVEVHNMKELDKVAGLPVRMVGINNRNLNTFEVDLGVTIELVNQLPQEILVITESGIKTSNDVSLMNSSGVQAFLVGEVFMKCEEPGKKLVELFY